MNTKLQASLVKVPQITLTFWIVKIAVTTLGETGGDAVSMSMGIGYAGSSVLFLLLFAVAVAFQIKSTEFNQYKYWVTVIATTTAGTTLADLADAVDPVPMKAIRVGAIDSGCGPKKCRSFSFAFDGRKLVWENRSLAPRLRPSRSPISSAVETSPPPL